MFWHAAISILQFPKYSFEASILRVPGPVAQVAGPPSLLQRDQGGQVDGFTVWASSMKQDEISRACDPQTASLTHKDFNSKLMSIAQTMQFESSPVPFFRRASCIVAKATDEKSS